MKRILMIALAFQAGSALAQQCDCQQIVGHCTGAIEFIKGYGSRSSYGAEIVVHSSEKNCSKVEYYVDSTPYQTLLVNKQNEPETLFGTSKISEKSVVYRSCSICASTDKDSKKLESSKSAKVVSPFQGSWSGSVRWMLSSSDISYNFSIEGGHVSGTFISQGHSMPIREGTVNGNTLNYTYVAAIDGAVGQGTLRLIGDGRASVTISTSGITFSGQVNRN